MISTSALKKLVMEAEDIAYIAGKYAQGVEADDREAVWEAILDDPAALAELAIVAGKGVLPTGEEPAAEDDEETEDEEPAEEPEKPTAKPAAKPAAKQVEEPAAEEEAEEWEPVVEDDDRPAPPVMSESGVDLAKLYPKTIRGMMRGR